MTPKQKAIKLKNRFQNEVGMFNEESKKSAIISVEEILLTIDSIITPNPLKQYWNEVIKEIKCL